MVLCMYLKDFFKGKCFQTAPDFLNEERELREEGCPALRVIGRRLEKKGAACWMNCKQEQLRT